MALHHRSPAYPVAPRPLPGIAVRVAGGVPALQPGLVNPQAAEVVPVREEPRVDDEPAPVRVGVELGRPGPDPAGVEDEVPRPVQRVGDVDAPAVAADLDHLRPAAEPLAGRGRVRLAPYDPAELDRAGLARVERVGDVVLLEFPCAPAGLVESA